MVAMPGGEFAMGSDADPTERPIHRVRIHPFAIGKFEVSVAEWQACVAGGGCSYKPTRGPPKIPPPSAAMIDALLKQGEVMLSIGDVSAARLLFARAAESEGPYSGEPDRSSMVNLSWDDATEYVHWLQKTTGKPYRLLTEAEWEYAARAGTETRYSWGEELKPGRTDCEGCGPNHDRSRPADIGSFPPNVWVVYDILPGREGILFIRTDNIASLRAHQKMGMREGATFEHDGVAFLALAYR
jgi:formylglycine-generating enzyme required for sulfatase activity